MNDPSTPSELPAVRPPRHEPHSGLKVYGVIFGLIFLCFVGCVGFTVAYLYYLEIRSVR